MDYEINYLAVSRAGHDCGRLYAVVGEEEPYYFLSDGKIRTTGHPKKKKQMHVQVVKHFPGKGGSLCTISSL